MLYNTNYTQQPINDAKKIATTIKKLENPLFIENLRIKRNNLSYFNPYNKPYDFTEAYRIVDTESFVSAAISKKKNLILKDGFKFVSENEDDILYIKRRLNEISFVTDTPFTILLGQIVDSLLHNHNMFLYIARKENASTGEVRVEGRRKIKPIAGFFHLSETKTDIIENNLGAVIGYKYNINRGIYNEFKKDEVLHLHINKKPDLNIGTPPLEAVKDDILSLRQIEENLERLIYKLSVPLIHAKVGSEKFPAGVDQITGRPEIDVVNDQILSMDDAGGITTTDRVDIKMLGAESQALRLSSYIDHFKNRVLVGLTISDVDLGTGTTTTGGAASIVSEALRQNVEMYQTTVEEFITDYIITPLLLERDKNSSKQYLEDEDKVQFKFNKSNLDSKIKLESHYINETNAKLITVDEYRVLTGRRALTKEEKNEFLKLSGKLPDGSNIPDALHPDEKALAKAKSSSSSSTAKKTTTTSKPKSSSNPTSNSTNPTNQHKKNLIRDELQLDRYLSNITDSRYEAANKLLTNSIYNEMKEYVDIEIEDCERFVRPLTNTLKTYIIKNINDYGIINTTVKNVIYKNILEYINKSSA